MSEDRRIYAVVAGTIQPRTGIKRTVVQPAGRQIAQVAHVVSKLRQEMYVNEKVWYEGFVAITTIVLQARDSAELNHVYNLLVKKKLNPVWFMDTNEFAYGP